MDRYAEGKPVWGPAGEKECTSDFFSRTCCWIDDEGEAIHKRCETCIDQGDGTYANCKITTGPIALDVPIPPSTPSPMNDANIPLGDSVLEQPTIDKGTVKPPGGGLESLLENEIQSEQEIIQTDKDLTEVPPIEEETQPVVETQQQQCNEGEVMDVSDICVTLEDGALEEPVEDNGIEQNAVDKNNQENIVQNSDNIERKNDLTKTPPTCPNKGPIPPDCTLKPPGF